MDASAQRDQTDAAADAPAADAPVAMPPGLKEHLLKLCSRAVRERSPREEKWDRNRLTGLGEGPGLTGDTARSYGDGAWRAGDYGAGQERLRVARQKLTTAKAALGDSVYKNNRVPFLLGWRASAAGSDEELANLKARVSEILVDARAASVLRDAIEDGATWGEYWIHGLVVAREGRMQAGVEVPSPWEMFVDPGREDDAEKAEYVIRRRRLTPYEIWENVAAGGEVFDQDAVRRAIAGARSGGGGEAREHPALQEGGRAQADTVEWREVWAWVPAALLNGAADGAADGAAPDGGAPETDPEWVSVAAYFAGGEPVAWHSDPGPRPYARFIWDRDRTLAHPQGIYDAMEDTQECLTGAVRTWLANLRLASRILLAGHRDQLRQDPEKIRNGIEWIDLDPDTRDVREAVQQLAIQPMTAGMVEAVEMLLTFADLESNIPRILQGQAPQADQTAFEIRNRLMAAGKYLGEVVRRHDAAIVWVVGWVLYIMALLGEIKHEAIVEVQALGFATYSDLVQKIDGLIRLLGLGAQHPEVQGVLATEWIARQIAEAEDIDTGKAFLPAEERQARQEAQAQSEERQLALAEAQARTEGLRAKAARDAAAAEDYRGRGQLGRAKFIKDVEDEAKGAAHGGRQEKAGGESGAGGAGAATTGGAPGA